MAALPKYISFAVDMTQQQKRNKEQDEMHLPFNSAFSSWVFTQVRSTRLSIQGLVREYS